MSYPGNPDAGRRPALRTTEFGDLLAATVGATRAELAALRADLEGIDATYAMVPVTYVGSALRSRQGGVVPFTTPEEAVAVPIPLGGPWRSAWVAPVVSGVWYQSYYAASIGNYPDSTSQWKFGTVGQADIWWIDDSGYTQMLEPRMNIVPIMPTAKTFRLELASNLSIQNDSPHLFLPIPVWFSRRVAIHDQSLLGF